MARWFEFSDQAWLPGPIRRCFTELLQFQASTYRIFDAAIPKLNQALRRSQSREILDLCSGSGGPLLDLVPHLRAERFTLSDRFPPARPARVCAVAPNVAWHDEPLDARAPIAIFEFTERRFERIWRLLFAPWYIVRDTWRMRPRNLARLFWTLVVPVVGHTWEAGTLPPGEALLRITYLFGVPTRTPPDRGAP
jgi:hypothetical protein